MSWRHKENINSFFWIFPQVGKKFNGNIQWSWEASVNREEIAWVNLHSTLPASLVATDVRKIVMRSSASFWQNHGLLLIYSLEGVSDFEEKWNSSLNIVSIGKPSNVMHIRVFKKWHFVNKKNCNTSTHPSGVSINPIQNLFSVGQV